MNVLKLNFGEKIPENYTGIIKYPTIVRSSKNIIFKILCRFKNKFWYKDGKIHREDGPAIIYYNGINYWFINGTNITNEVNDWIIENNIPDYKLWNNTHKILFKLRF